MRMWLCRHASRSLVVCLFTAECVGCVNHSILMNQIRRHHFMQQTTHNHVPYFKIEE